MYGVPYIETNPLTIMHDKMDLSTIMHERFYGFIIHSLVFNFTELRFVFFYKENESFM